MILLTGSSGFLGREILSILNPNSVKVVKRGQSNVIGCQESYSIDKLDSKTNWSGAFSGVDCVLHLAAVAHKHDELNTTYDEINTRGTLNLALAAAHAGVKRFVFVSSIGVNGSATKNNKFTVASKPSPHSHYARSKYEAEVGLKKISDETGLEIVIVRAPLVYGLNAPGNFGMLTKFIHRFPILPFGLARNQRDFISLPNLADLLVVCTSHPKAAGHTFLASDNDPVSIKELTNAIADGLGKRVIQLPIPKFIMHFLGKMAGKSTVIDQLFGDLRVDSSNLREILDWTPPFTMKQVMSSLRNSGK